MDNIDCDCGWCAKCIGTSKEEKDDEFYEKTEDLDCEGCGFCEACLKYDE